MSLTNYVYRTCKFGTVPIIKVHLKIVDDKIRGGGYTSGKNPFTQKFRGGVALPHVTPQLNVLQGSMC